MNFLYGKFCAFRLCRNRLKLPCDTKGMVINMEENRQPLEAPLEEMETVPQTPVDEPMEEREANTRESVDAPTSQKNSTDGLVIGIAAGMITGILIGFLLRQMPFWIVGGILLGGAIGCLLDLRRDRQRKKVCPDAAPATDVPISNDMDAAQEQEK